MAFDRQSRKREWAERLETLWGKCGEDPGTFFIAVAGLLVDREEDLERYREGDTGLTDGQRATMRRRFF